ncbi:unnamed protein product [Rhizophagus irregularis]|nr:unnamed protein product [Rhizophagus irregularis]
MTSASRYSSLIMHLVEMRLEIIHRGNLHNDIMKYTNDLNEDAIKKLINGLDQGEFCNEIMNLNRDELEQHMHTKFNKVKDEAKKIVEDVVEDIKNEAISQLPEEPKMTGEETVEEHNTKVKAYEKNLNECKIFYLLSMNKVKQIVNWLSELQNTITTFFKNLRSWIVSKINNIYTRILEFFTEIAKMFSRLYKIIFKKD